MLEVVRDTPFVYHLSLVIALGAVALLLPREQFTARRYAMLQGILFGLVAVVSMLNPIAALPGVHFDGRSVLVSLAALFYGPIAAVLSSGISIAFRLYQGGVGAPIGVFVTVASALLGLAFRRRYSRHHQLSLLQLLALGMVVHLSMLASMFLLLYRLPLDEVLGLLRVIALPVLSLYPLATVLLGRILSNHESQAHLLQVTRDSESRLLDVIRNAPVAMALCTANGDITFQNRRHRELFGYDLAEIPTVDAWMTRAYPDPDYRKEVSDAWDEAMRQVAPREGVVPTQEFRITNKAGEQLFIEITAISLDQEMLATFADMTAHRLAEIESHRMQRLYAMLSQTNKAITRCTDANVLLDEVCKIAVESGHFCFAWFGVPQADGTVLPVARAGEDHGYIDKVHASVNPDDPHGMGLIGRAVRSGNVRITNHFMETAATMPWHELAKLVGVGALGVFPVFHDGVVHGVLNLYALEEDFFGDKETATVREMAADISYELDNLAREQERTHAVVQVRILSERMKNYLDLSPVISYLLTFQNEQFHTDWVSENIFHLLGYSVEEASRDGWWMEHVHPDDRDEAAARVLNATSQRELRHEYRFFRKDGSMMWILDTLRVTPNVEDGSLCIYGAWTDITERKLAEQRQQESHALLTNLAERVPGVLFKFRMAPDGAFSFPYASPGMRDIYEFEPDELLEDATPGFTRVHPEDVESMLQGIHESARTLQPYHGEFRVILPEKGLRWCSCEARPSRAADGGTLWHGIIMDITDRKASEEVQRLQVAALNAAANAIVVTNRDGEIQWVNPAFTRVTQFDYSEVVGKNPRGLVYSGLHDKAFYKDLWDTILGGNVWRGILTNRKKDGTLYTEEQIITPIRNGSGEITHFVGVKEDVTDRVRTERALQDSEQRLQRAVAIANIALWEWNVANDDVYYSPEWTRHVGNDTFGQRHSLDEWFARVHPDDLALLQPQLRKLKADSPLLQREFRLRHDAGQYRWILLNASPVTDETGALSRIVGTNVDITERKHLEHEFEQSQKLESIGRLAGGIAHDFNNLLSVIGGYSEMALASETEGSPLHKDLTQIKRASDRAASLTRQLLAFSRRQVLSPEVLNINRIVLDAEPMLRRLIGEDIDLQLDMASDLGTTLADPGQVEQVLLNLAVNARDAMPSGGALTIKTANVRVAEASELQNSGAEPGPFVCISVMDTGIGMDDALLERIFEPFFTTKEQGKGTGLGLATVYGIVKQSDGYITARSQPDLGTTFEIYLPRVDALEQVVAPVSTQQASHGHETVLLVEDETDLREIAQRFLERAGYQVLAADGPEQAQEIYAKFEESIDLLLTDVIMPQMSGPILATLLREKHPDLKVLYMSGYTDDMLANHGVLDTGVKLLLKPFKAAQLTGKVREVLDS